VCVGEFAESVGVASPQFQTNGFALNVPEVLLMMATVFEHGENDGVNATVGFGKTVMYVKALSLLLQELGSKIDNETV
jgi:hypothetical protein